MVLRSGPRRGRTTRSTAAGRRRRRRPAARHRTGDRTRRCCWTRTGWPRGCEYFEVANLAVSPDHRWLAYATDTTGGEASTWPSAPLAGGAERSPTGPRGRSARHLLRAGLGQRQRHRLLHPGRRGHAALPAVAAPAGHRPGGRRAGAGGGRRAVHPRRSGRTKDGAYVVVVAPDQHHQRGLGHPGRRARRRRPGWSSRGARASSTRSSTTPAAGRPRMVRHAHQRRGRGLPADGGPGRRRPGGIAGGRSWPTGPAPGWRTSTSSTTGWWCPNGSTGSPGCG